MVWAGNDSWPIGSQTATSVITTGGYTFDLAGHYNNSIYLDVVEAGLEITRGSGWAYVTANISAR
jgi:hypothetical protein